MICREYCWQNYVLTTFLSLNKVCWLFLVYLVGCFLLWNTLKNSCSWAEIIRSLKVDESHLQCVYIYVGIASYCWVALYNIYKTWNKRELNPRGTPLHLTKHDFVPPVNLKLVDLNWRNLTFFITVFVKLKSLEVKPQLRWNCSFTRCTNGSYTNCINF